MGGEGQVIHTRGELATPGRKAVRRVSTRPSRIPIFEVVDETPGDWQIERLPRSGRTCCSASPTCGRVLPSDDMALAAQSVVEAAGKQDQVRGRVDGLKMLPKRSSRTSCWQRLSPERPHPRGAIWPVPHRPPAPTWPRAAFRSSFALMGPITKYPMRQDTSAARTTCSTNERGVRSVGPRDLNAMKRQESQIQRSAPRYLPPPRSTAG